MGGFQNLQNLFDSNILDWTRINSFLIQESVPEVRPQEGIQGRVGHQFELRFY